MNIFGGKAAREGVTSTVVVKGDRKATMNDETGQIVDLAEEKVYDLDLKKKTYKVTTFAELRRRMEEEQKKAAGRRQAQRSRRPREAAAGADPNAKEIEVDFDIKNTGQKKTINGFDTHEVVMTITVREKGKTLEQSGGMVLTSDMWLAPTIAAMKEVADFDMRYAQKLYGGDGRRRVAGADGGGDGDVSDDEAGARQDERRGRKMDGTADPDRHDDGRGEVGRADAAGSAVLLHSDSDGQRLEADQRQRRTRRHARRRMKKNSHENKDGAEPATSRGPVHDDDA